MRGTNHSSSSPWTILQLGLLVLLGKIMPPLLPVQSQLRQDFKKKDDGLQALGLESLHCKSARVQLAAKGFYPIDSEVRYFSPMITLISPKETCGGSTTTTIPININNHIFFGSFPQTKFSNHLPGPASLAPWEYTMHC